MFKLMMPMFDVPGAEGGGGGAPTDLGDVISQSISGLDEGDFAPTGGDAIPKPEVKEPAAADDEAELAKLEAEIRAKNPTMKGSMNIHRHQAVLTRQRNQAAKELAEWKAKNTEWTTARAEYEKQLNEWKQYEWAKDTDITNALRAIELSETDQRKFAELLLNDPRYAEILQLKEAQAAAAQVPNDRPGPNQRTPDGKTQYYDAEGLQKLLDWQAAQVEKHTAAQLEKKFAQEMDKRFGEYKPLKDQFELNTAWNNALRFQRGVVAKAKENWPGFKEADDKGLIKKYMVANPKSDLNEAYMEVVIKQQAKDDAAKEAAWRLKYQKEMELKARAGGSNLKPQVGSGVERMTGAAGDKRDLGDIIREQISRAR